MSAKLTDGCVGSAQLARTTPVMSAVRVVTQDDYDPGGENHILAHPLVTAAYKGLTELPGKMYGSPRYILRAQPKGLQFVERRSGNV